MTPSEGDTYNGHKGQATRRRRLHIGGDQFDIAAVEEDECVDVAFG